MAKPLSVLEIVSQASLEIGITQRPLSTVTGSQDHDVIQMTALLSAVADEVLLDEPYSHLLGDGIWLKGSDGVPKPAITTDGDVVLFDGRLAVNGVKFRFLKAKGLEFGEEMRDFTNRQNKVAGRLIGRVLDLDVEEDRTI